MGINVDALLKRKADLEKSLATAIETRNAMEGRMQSRYDTQREEWALQCEVIESQIEQVNKALTHISRLEKPTARKEVSVGSVVQLRFDVDEPETYILLDESGGYDLKDMVTLSAKSPVGQAILGAKVGDEVCAKVGNRTIHVEIVSIGGL